ncbi:Rho GTPase-activating protein domain [Trinorchestia longiramus]|nr:Rho GTPase-activating protein domain [Trinorchestia longiramus]
MYTDTQCKPGISDERPMAAETWSDVSEVGTVNQFPHAGLPKPPPTSDIKHGGNLWLSVTGAVVTLESTSLLQLTELERLTLQQLALAKIAALNLGCSVTLPKESSSVSSSKKRKPYLLKRKALTTGFFDSKRDESKDSASGSGGLVFGLSLVKCLENERLKQQQQQGVGGADLVSPVSNSAAGADGGLPEEPLTGTLSRKSSHTGSHGSFCSLAEGVKQSSTGSLESLNLDRKRPSLVSGDVLAAAGISELLHVDAPLSQVPALVTTCCNHLLNHGLHTVGIFRVSSSKKRVRQLREEFDQGGEVLLTEEHCPHDVATLLKEFFRDLPEPLLTRDLYEPFLCTQRIRNRKLKLEATQYLLQLLPPANRDTLCALLSFLTCVAEHAVDSVSDSGETIPGNMMDSRNLATMFAPNILHMHRAGADNASPAALAAMADERMDCTNVVRSMIDHNKELFEVSAELLDETYHHLMDTHPEALDVMLRRRASPHDDRGQQLLQQLLASLLQPGRLPSSSPPYSPGHPGLEGDAESGSSVFDGSECSLSLPRSPTEHQEFERLRGAEDSEGMSRQRNLPPDHAEERQDRRKYEDDGGKFSGGTEAHVEERGWFRRRDKSSSREFDKPLEEKQVERSRWFRRRDKASPRNSIDYGIRRKGSDKKKSEKPPKREEKISLKRRSSIDRGRGSGSDSADSRDQRQRSSSDQTVAQERLRVPEESLRRLSSPEIDSSGVITASLKIPVPLQQQVVPTSSARESDIPFIEDSVLAEEVRTRRRDTSVNTSRPRTGSSDSYLGQPITGTMSFQPLCKKDIEKQSHDSVLSSSTDMLTLSPSPRNTPVSDVMIASETSSPLSRATSPPVMLSPDSGTPGLSPPPSPPPLLPRRTRRTDQPVTRSTPLSHSATHTFGTKAHIYSTTYSSSTKERITMQSGQPITRSRTAEVPSSTVMPSKDSKDSGAVSAGSFGGSRTPSGVRVDVYNITGGLPRPSNTGDNSSENKKYTNRRGSNSKEGSLSTQQQTLIQQQQFQQYQSQQQVTHRQTPAPAFQQSQHPQRQPGTTETMPAPQLWKRCEIIASDPSDPKARL